LLGEKAPRMNTDKPDKFKGQNGKEKRENLKTEN
jgi:hypothetical protein